MCFTTATPSHSSFQNKISLQMRFIVAGVMTNHEFLLKISLKNIALVARTTVVAKRQERVKNDLVSFFCSCNRAAARSYADAIVGFALKQSFFKLYLVILDLKSPQSLYSVGHCFSSLKRYTGSIIFQ